MSSGGRTNDELTRLVKELRSRLADVITSDSKYDDDYYLIQWLKRHGFKPSRTESYIRETIKWWKANDIESMVQGDKETLFPGLAQEFPVYIDAMSKYGQPVVTFNGNGVDFAAVIKKYNKPMLLRYLYFLAAKSEFLMKKQIERIRTECPNIQYTDMVENKCVGKDGHVLPVGIIIIASFKDVSLWVAKSPVVISTMFEAAKVVTTYFPIFATHILVINTNKVIESVFKLMYPLIASPYYPIDCFDINKEKWSAALLERINPDQLTPEFGGTKVSYMKNAVY